MRYVLHHNDVDGICSAFAVWMVLKDAAKYISVQYGKPLPELYNPTKVYIVDFSYKKEIIAELCKRCEVVLLDHHVTAQNELSDFEHRNLTKIIDTARSGAMITWEYMMMYLPIPNFVRDVQDYDLWKFERPNTKYIHEYLNLVGFDMDEYFSLLLENKYKHAVEKGMLLHRAKMKQVEYISNSKSVQTDSMGNVFAKVNSPIHMNEIAEHIYSNDEKISYVDVYSISDYNGKLYERHSLRSNGVCDVRAIAEKYNGGGHTSSAGYSVSL